MKINLAEKSGTLEWLLPKISQLRSEGKTIVTTNGCFDILHSGHIHYLNDAASFGDSLIIGINSDASVSRLKGPSRPLQKEMDRAYILSALSPVDFVFIFEEDDPCTFLDKIQPDVHVKGGDYTPERLPETAVVEKHGGRIVIVPFLQGYSSTSLINRI